jgi:hypothetical protein
VIRLRRAAPSIMVLGVVIVSLTTATAAVAQMALAGKATDDIAALVIDRLAYLVIANVTVWALVAVGMWRWSGARLQAATREAIEEHDASEGAHKIAAHANHVKYDESIAELDKGMAVILSEIRAIRQAVQPLAELDERLRLIEEDHAAFHGKRDPGASPRRHRIDDPSDFDGTKHRGRG